MKFFSTILAVTPSLVAWAQAQSPSCGCTPNISYTDSTYHGYILDQYVALWGGNYSLLDTVVSPDVGYYQDQLPVYGHIPIYNSSQLLGFIEASRDGWSSFGFVGQYWISEGYKIAFRYTFEGVISNASLQYPTATAAVGSQISYNGTDFYLINPCTGLIDEVDSATDYLNFFQTLGVKELMLA